MGFLRLFLALSVISDHTVDGHFGIGGREAVLLFYIISGFYMALILNEKYTGPHTNILFYISRFLRLWVPYIVFMLLIMIPYAFSGDLKYYENIYKNAPIGAVIFGVFSNIFIFGQDLLWLFSTTDTGIIWRPMGTEGFNGVTLSLNAPLFSVSLELYFYLLAPFVLRNKRFAFLFAFAGLAYHALLTHFNVSALSLSYHFFPATIAYFGIGGVLYHLSHGMKKDYKDYVLAFFMLGLVAFNHTLIPKIYLFSLIVSLPFIFALTKHWRIDRIVGEMSYGMYICHLPLIQIFNKTSAHVFGLGQFFDITVLTIAASLALHLCVERPLTRYRETLLRRHKEKMGLSVPAGDADKACASAR